MKILHLSDTHGFHESITDLIKEMILEHEPEVIVHSGDFMRHAMKSIDFEEFLNWFRKLDVKHKILVPGNHDIFCEAFENDYDLRRSVVPDSVLFLINEEVVIDGVKFWGSPYTPEFFDWGFQLYGADGWDLWAKIPDDTDVLITHGPQLGVLDKLPDGLNVGCPFLAQRIDELKIKAHLVGHIHGAYGIHQSNDYVSLNSAILNDDYKPVNKPQLVEI